MKYINNEIIQEDQNVLSIRTVTTMEELPLLIDAAYQNIADYIKELGETPSDVPFTAYHKLEVDSMDVEIGFPVSKPLPGKGEIKPGVIRKGKVLTCSYIGPYSGLDDPYNEMFAWIADNGYEPTGVVYEYYYNSPDEVPEEELVTKIVIPLR